jgi:hypothetical protein
MDSDEAAKQIVKTPKKIKPRLRLKSNSALKSLVAEYLLSDQTDGIE